MSLQENVMTEMKAAMRAKDSVKLEALRAVKSAILLANTESASKEGLSEDEELKLLQKLVKQRKDSAAIYREQGRPDLAEPEEKQAEVIAQFLPEQLSEAEIETKVDEIIAKTGASGMQDMGKVMGVASQELAGKADGKTISMIVKKKLSK
ncbi:GatB/YqeY domain-containing protein [Salegentibacter sp. HM20]